MLCVLTALGEPRGIRRNSGLIFVTKSNHFAADWIHLMRSGIMFAHSTGGAASRPEGLPRYGWGALNAGQAWENDRKGRASNPYSRGICPRTPLTKRIRSTRECFNPCFLGTCPRTYYPVSEPPPGEHVSILVFLELALGPRLRSWYS